MFAHIIGLSILKKKKCGVPPSFNLLIYCVRFIKIELSGSAGTSVTHHGLQAVLTLEDLHTLHLNNTRDKIYREKDVKIFCLTSLKK